MGLEGRYWFTPTISWLEVARKKGFKFMPLSGEYWLTPDGLMSVAGTEHANVVKRRMLRLVDSEEAALYVPMKKTFEPITEEEAAVHAERGVPEKELMFLRTNADPRNWAMREWGWVRAAKSIFNSWFFDDPTLDMVRANKQYWNLQRFNLDEHTIIDWNVMSTGQVLRVNAQKMLNPAAQAEVLARLGAGIMQFRNPSAQRSPCCAAVLAPLEEVGQSQCTNCGKIWTW